MVRVPRVQMVEAIPLVVDVAVGGLTDPAPSITDHEICTPATGLLN